MFIYSIKNEKIGFFNKPIFANSDDEALNILRETIACDYTSGLLSLAPELGFYCNGIVDFHRGDYITPSEGPRLLCNIGDFMSDVADSIKDTTMFYRAHSQKVDNNG